MLDIPTAQVLDFQDGLFRFIDTKYPEIPAGIREKKEITPELDELLGKAINEYKAQR